MFDNALSLFSKLQNFLKIPANSKNKSKTRDDDIVTEQDCHMALLLPYTLKVIFQHMTVPDRCKAAQVCRAWRRELDQPIIWSGALANLRPYYATTPWECLRRRQIRRIRVLTPMTDHYQELLSVVLFIDNLSCLDLSGYHNVSAEILLEVFREKLPHLTDLNLDGCSHMNDDISILISQNMLNLISLNLVMCFQLTNDSLVHISSLRRLRRLSLSNYKHITDRGIANLLRPDCLPAFELLKLDNYCCYNRRTLPRLRIGQPGLMEMRLDQESDRLPKYSFEKLTSLTIRGCDLLGNLNLTYCEHMTGPGLRHLAQLVKQRDLDIWICSCISVSTDWAVEPWSDPASLAPLFLGASYGCE